jgi:hypothetical protein
MPPENLPLAPIFPRKLGPFIRAAGDDRQVVVGQWGLIPWFTRMRSRASSVSSSSST